MASNMLILLGQQGHLNLFIERMVTILAYEPIQLLDKLQELFNQEFSRISHYDLIFYSEITKDLLTVFDEKDS